MPRGMFAGLFLACVLLFLGAPAAAQDDEMREQPVALTADTMTYDQDLGLVTARGNVEIVQGERVLLADTVTYNQRTGKVTATGNVSLMEPTGEVLFADYVELTDEMRNGFISGLRVLLSDNSRFAASSGERRDGNRLVLDRAVYSPCNLCPDDPSQPPLWQIKSVQVIHNQEAKRIEYKDATLEFFGIPALYLPYFSHPDPTVRRQSGFLAPAISNNSFFGVRTRVPYYWAIGPDRDATFTPQFTAKEGIQLAGEYRQRTATGEFTLDGSITRVDRRDAAGNLTDGKEVRGHFRGDGRFRYDDQYLYGFNIFRSSDDTYLRRYDIPTESTNSLTSRLYVEGFNGPSYLSANGYSFQSLRPDDEPGSTPVILPLVEYHYVGQPDEYGGRFGLDANLLSLYRSQGTDTRRASLTGYWQLPYYAPAGDVYTLTLSLRGDGYWVREDVEKGGPPGVEESDFTGRIEPLVALDWRYPFVRSQGSIQQLVEPIASLILTPYGGNPPEIPNEDSQSLEFDETNLFSFSRFPGLDRYDGGPRFNYGVRAGAYGVGGGFSEILVGQSLRLREDDSFAPGSGLSDQKSDYVGRLIISPGPFLEFSDRIRVDQDSWSLRRHEVAASIGPPALRMSLTYAALDQSVFADEIQDREAIAISGFAQLTKHWSLTGYHLRDLGADEGSLRTFVGLRYTDECFDIMFFGERTFTVDRDIQPTTTFGIRFRLANVS